MVDLSLSLAARASVTLTALVFAIVVHRIWFRGAPRTGAIALGVPLAVAAACSHIPGLVDGAPRYLPVGLAIAMVAAIGSLGSGATRRAFAAASDGEIRMLLAFRAMFGALLLALGATGHMPIEFALSAGLGDMITTWLAFAVPARLDTGGPRWARLAVHGFGLIDMTLVIAGAAAVARPWSAAHGDAMTAMALPWFAVPLMFAINAHGIRAAIGGAEAVGDRSQPAHRVRSAAS